MSTHPATIGDGDVWRIAARCAGAGAGYVLAVRGDDAPVPREHLIPLVVEIMADFGFTPSPDVAAFSAEFEAGP
jgi:hypothetical protein